MTLIRRLPKRGFTNIFKVECQIVNLESLNVFKDGDAVNIESLLNKNLIKTNDIPVKILGGGELKKKITVEAHRFSKSAEAKIKKAGGGVKHIK